MKNINNQSKNNKKTKIETLVSIVILSLTLVFILGSIIQQAISITKTNLGLETKQVIKETEFKSIQECNIKILFSNITTTVKQYELLREACESYIRKNDTSTIKVNTDVEISEHTYIDSNGNSITNKDNDKLHETGPMYLTDKLLIRYINEKGEMKIVISKFKDNTIIQGISKDLYTEKREIDTVDIKDINKLFNTKQETLWEIQPYNTNKTLGLNISEEAYLRDIEEIFIEIIKHSSEDIDENIKEKALKYFTYEGYLTIVEGVSHIQSNSTVTVQFTEAGKSSLDKTYKDRIIMQVKIESTNNTIYTNIIIKLNDLYKVFDIDII